MISGKLYYRCSVCTHAMCNAYHLCELERLQLYERGILKVYDQYPIVSFRYNQGEKDIRMA